MNFYALLKLHKRIKSPKLKLLGLGLASAVGFRHLSVRLDPTLRCNLACRMCYFSGEGYKAKAGGLIQRDELEGLAKTLFPHAFQLVLGCGAEPTLARHYHEFFRLAKRYGVPDVSMVTNGQLIERDDLEKMADAGVNELILSVHGVREATYESFMPGARYVRLLELLGHIKELRNLREGAFPDLRINYTVNPDNLEELKDFFEVFGAFGVSTLQVRPVMDLGGVYKGSISEALQPRYREMVAFLKEGCRQRQIRLLANTNDAAYEEKSRDADLGELVYTYVSPRTASQLGIDWRSCSFRQFRRANAWYKRLADAFWGRTESEGWLDRSLKYEELN